MSYTSGRTVKSAKRQAPTTVASATADARRLAKQRLDWDRVSAVVTFSSSLTSDPVTLDLQVVTVVTFPERVDASDLACAIEGMPGLIRSTWSPVSVIIVRAA